MLSNSNERLRKWFENVVETKETIPIPNIVYTLCIYLDEC